MAKNYLHEKTVLITGASSGIGWHLAKQLMAYDVNLVLVARRVEKLSELKAALLGAGETNKCIETFAVDVSDREGVRTFLDSLLASYNIDVLVNNAGLALDLEPVDRGDIDSWEAMIDTNLKGLLYVTKPVMQQMRSRDTGHIVNLGSVAGKMAYPNGNVYCATKSAVRMLGDSLNADLFGTQVKVSTIAPGAVETAFSQVRFHGDEKRAEEVYQGFTPLVAEDIAEAMINVLNTPPHVNIQYLDIMPTAQRNPYLLHRD